MPRTFWALDFDRCLGGTPALYDLFASIIQELGIISTTQLQDARHKIEQTGGSFDVISYLYQYRLIDDAMYDRVVETYCQRAHDDPRGMLEPGAEAFLEWLRRANQAFGILSYGDERWQRLKIAASGLSAVNTMITPEKRKGRLIASWYGDQEAAYTVPSIFTSGSTQFDEVVLVDDKAVAFDTLPATARGYWLQIERTLLPSQQGSVPGNVTIVQSFTEIMEHENV